MSKELSVEEALNELRELMPGQFITIESRRRDDLDGYGEVDTVECWVHIMWMRATRGRGETMAEAMAEFRQWAKQWKESQKDQTK